MAAAMDGEPAISQRDEFQRLFQTSFSKWKEDKKNLSIKPDEVYDAILEAFRKKQHGEKMSSKEHNWTVRYCCLRHDGKDMIQHNEKFVVKESKLFELLYGVHLDQGHSGRDIMFYELKKDFDGISKEVLTIFVKCCQHCELKKGKVKRGVVVKPILSADQNSRCQVDLIDYQAKPDGGISNLSDEVNEDAETNDSNEADGVETVESNDTDSAEPTESDGSRPQGKAVEVEDSNVNTADAEEIRVDDVSETEDLVRDDLLRQKQEQTQKNRETARKGQKRQAEKMLELSAKRFKHFFFLNKFVFHKFGAALTNPASDSQIQRHFNEFGVSLTDSAVSQIQL